MNIKKLNNKRYKADKAYWYLKNERDSIWGPEHFIITDYNYYTYENSSFFPTHGVGYLKALIKAGGKPCTYVRMVKLAEEFNKNLKIKLDDHLELIDICCPYEDEQVFRERAISNYNHRLLHTKEARAIRIKEI